jgi:hypothetical protein
LVGVRHEEGFGVIKLALGGGKLKIQIEGIGSTLLLCESQGGLARLAWTQENYGRKLVQKLD